MTVARLYIPGEVIATAFGALLAWGIALSIALARTRERVVRLDEWVRLHDRPPEQPDEREAKP